MGRFSGVTSGQILGFFLLLVAWLANLGALVVPEWCRSEVRVREFAAKGKHRGLMEPSYQANRSTPVPGPIRLVPMWVNRTHLSRPPHHRWLTVGYKGLWQECANIPDYDDTVVVVASSTDGAEKAGNSSGNIVYHLSDPERRAATSPHKSSNVTDIPRHTVMVTPPNFFRSKLLGPADRHRSVDCSFINMTKVSCLLLGIRTLALLGFLGGLMAIALSCLSICADRKLRGFSATQTNLAGGLRGRNTMALLASAMSGLSGILLLVSCWWFTLDTNLAFTMPAYQVYHEKTEAFFVAGTGIFVSISTGVVYLLASVLLGANLGERKERLAQLDAGVTALSAKLLPQHLPRDSAG